MLCLSALQVSCGPGEQPLSTWGGSPGVSFCGGMCPPAGVELCPAGTVVGSSPWLTGCTCCRGAVWGPPPEAIPSEGLVGWGSGVA